RGDHREVRAAGRATRRRHRQRAGAGMAPQGGPADRAGAAAADDLRGLGAAQGRQEVTSDRDHGLDSSDEFEDEDDLDLSAEDEDDDLDEDDVDEIGAEGNRIVGGVPKGVLEYVARNIVDDPDGVFVETSERRGGDVRSEEHTSELQSPCNLVCRL